MINFVLAKNPDVSIRNTAGYTALTYGKGILNSLILNVSLGKFKNLIYFKAITWSCPRVVKTLILCGANPNEKDQEGVTPLMEGISEDLF